MPSASLWAAMPHYVAVAPNPKGALALLRRLESLVGVTVDAQQLEDAAVDYERQVTRAVEIDPEVQAFVERLERAADEEEGRPDRATSRRATCSRASSSASCASAATGAGSVARPGSFARDSVLVAVQARGWRRRPDRRAAEARAPAV